MRFSLGVDCSTSVFSFNGRRSFYGRILFGGNWLWIQRWDNERAPRNRFRSGDMGWTWGIHKGGK